MLIGSSSLRELSMNRCRRAPVSFIIFVADISVYNDYGNGYLRYSFFAYLCAKQAIWVLEGRRIIRFFIKNTQHRSIHKNELVEKNQGNVYTLDKYDFSNQILLRDFSSKVRHLLRSFFFYHCVWIRKLKFILLIFAILHRVREFS